MNNVAEQYVNFLAETSTDSAMPLDEIKQETAGDKTLLKAIEYVRNGKWHELKQIKDCDISIEDLTQLRNVRDELTVHSENVLLKSGKIVLPTSLYAKAIEIGHEGHQGMSKTKAFVRSKIWFPRLNEFIEEKIKNCLACQANTYEKKYSPLNMSELPVGPWQDLSADFCGPLPSGEYLLVITDEYSRYPIVEIVPSVSSKKLFQ
ncbi:uncharacterized protein K02A2.6-like [Ruditapes philippinarum]|uniref:uncharacterized protein K02A2.6-like n=1 Tax=Ruditapes philippinarum TaxID=129788 RepID=UPI00295B58D2|nr:uncharacterized protein K02A2.6-like [Ruditapes philippinarum]